MNNDDMNLLKYAQDKVYNAFVEVLDIYKDYSKFVDLQNLTVATLSLETRLSLGKSMHAPNRSKGLNSFIKNLNSVFDRELAKIPENPSKSDIDTAVSNAKNEIIKDFYGATIVFHNDNEMDDYCENSNDETLKKLYQLEQGIKNYLLQSKILSKLPQDKKTNNALIDISDTFIDSQTPKTNTLATPFNPNNINTLEDYYNQLISLLTLLTNASMFEVINPATGEIGSKRIISEIDMSMIDFVHLVELSDYVPTGNYEYIQLLLKLAHTYYLPNGPLDEHLKNSLKNIDLSFYDEHLKDAHKPFDEQLKNALSAKKSLGKKELSTPLTSNQKEYYGIKLAHLGKNLKLLQNDRLLNYILKKELGSITRKLCDLEHLKLKIEPDTYLDSSSSYNTLDYTKTVAKLNSFVATYLNLTVNDLASIELQVRDEFRDNLASSGASAHNSLQGKGFNIFQFFELANPTHSEKLNTEQYITLCNFLNFVNHNTIKPGNDKSRVQKQYKSILVDRIKFAKDRLKLKDDFTSEWYQFENNEIPYTYQQDSELASEYKANRNAFIEKISQNSKAKISFREYIQKIIEFYCAKYRDIRSNHPKEDHNTVAIQNQTDKDVLLDFFKNRIGISVLAYMIIEKYTLGYPETTHGSYDTISDPNQANTQLKTATENALKPSKSLKDKDGNPIYFPEEFKPMGSSNEGR